MSGAGAVAQAVVFIWLGMVIAISFVEAPLKFQAPGITVQLGLGIGRLVFRALNAIETVFAAVLMAAIVLDPPRPDAVAAIVVAVAVLTGQLVGVRPRLRRRSDAVLASAKEPPGGIVERSSAHYVYAGLELVKVAALLGAGVALLT